MLLLQASHAHWSRETSQQYSQQYGRTLSRFAAETISDRNTIRHPSSHSCQIPHKRQQAFQIGRLPLPPKRSCLRLPLLSETHLRPLRCRPHWVCGRWRSKACKGPAPVGPCPPASAQPPECWGLHPCRAGRGPQAADTALPPGACWTTPLGGTWRCAAAPPPPPPPTPTRRSSLLAMVCAGL